MANSYVTHTGTGAQTLFTFTFPYLSADHVKVSINDVANTAWTLANATTVQFNSAPANGAAIKIYRDTPTTSLLTSFNAGSAIRAADLNNGLKQILYVSDETADFAADTDASAIQSTANTALANSNTAITTANSASATANGLAASISTANNNATTAVNTANAASADATSALSTANAAQSTANAALPKAGGIMTGDISFADSGEGIVFSDSTKVVTISNSTSTTSSTTAASSTAVKSAYDLADAALPKTSVSDSTSTTSSTTAASSTAVKSVKDVFDALDASLVGAVMAFAANAAPTGWVKCNGAAVNRTGTYARLWTFAQASGNLAGSEGAKQSGQFGPGNGSTTFTLPDLRGEFVRGWADDRAVDTGRGIGTAQTDDYKQHSHTITDPGHSHGITGGTTTNGSTNTTIATNGTSQSTSTNSATTGITGTNNSPTSGGTETRPRNVALLYCIKY